MSAIKRALPAVAAAIALLAIANGASVAETAAEVPKDSYYDDPLTPDERSGIAQEENVLPNDGSPSVPNGADDGVIPDATIDQGTAAPQVPAPMDETAEKKKAGESEANIVIDDSKKNYKVTKKSFESCMKDWSPQTQMTKEEWAASCRTTLEYFPDGQ